jgi:hypothetical protein
LLRASALAFLAISALIPGIVVVFKVSIAVLLAPACSDTPFKAETSALLAFKFEISVI